jgi:hypothetical protein
VHRSLGSLIRPGGVGARQEPLARGSQAVGVRRARELVRRYLFGSGWRRQLKIGFRISVVAY